MRGDAPGSAFLSFRAGAHAGVGEEIRFPCWCFDSFSSQHKKNESPSPESDSLYQSICPLPKPLKTLRFQGFFLFYGKTSDALPGSRLLRQAGRLNDEKKTAREGRSFSIFSPDGRSAPPADTFSEFLCFCSRTDMLLSRRPVRGAFSAEPTPASDESRKARR